MNHFECKIGYAVICEYSFNLSTNKVIYYLGTNGKTGKGLDIR